MRFHTRSFSLPPGSVSLAREDIHLWLADLDCAPESLAAFEQTLSNEELARARRFRLSRHRREWTAARGILRCLLGRYLGLGPTAVRFTYSPQGKPEVQQPPQDLPLRFNLAHSHGAALFGFALDRDIGVDLELVRPDCDAAGIASRFFAPAEITLLRALPAERQTAAFFEVWTRKEAFVKACGRGLSHPLDHFAVELAAEGLPTPISAQDADFAGQGWITVGLTVGKGFAAALATNTPSFNLCRWLFAAS